MSTCEKRYLDVWIYVCIYESNVNGSTTDAIDAKTINWKKNWTPQKIGTPQKMEQKAETLWSRLVIPTGTKGFRPGAPRPRPRGGPSITGRGLPGRKPTPPLVAGLQPGPKALWTRD